MSHRKLHQLLVRVFSILVLILIPVAVAAGLMAGRIFAGAKAEVTSSAEREARIIATQELRIFAGIRNTLLGVSEFAEVSNPNTRDCSRTIAILMNHINTLTKQFLNLGIADQNGDIICSALPLPKPVNIADRDYFKRAIANRDFSFGNYQIGRVTGQPTINFAYPIMNNVGIVDAVVFAALDLNALNDTIGRLDVPGGASLTITDENNVILVEFPEVNGLIGKTWGQNMVQKLEYYGEGSIEDLNTQGVPSIFGVSKIELPNQATHFHVIVGLPIGFLFKETSFNLSLGMALFLVSLAVAVICGWLLGGRIIKHLALPD